MLVLAFDTATDLATSALIEDGCVLGERVGIARSLLCDVDALLGGAGRTSDDIDALVVGTGPGSFTSTRIGLAAARGLALALDVQGAGVSTLTALGSQAGAFPIIDARRREVFVEGPRALYSVASIPTSLRPSPHTCQSRHRANSATCPGWPSPQKEGRSWTHNHVSQAKCQMAGARSAKWPTPHRAAIGRPRAGDA